MNAPMYASELAPVHIRGRLVTPPIRHCVWLFTRLLATYFIGQGQTEDYNVSTGWRIMFWSELVPSLLFLVLLFIVPKSPRWLFLKGKEQEARDILIKHQGEDGIEETISEISTAIKESEGALSLTDLLKATLVKSL